MLAVLAETAAAGMRPAAHVAELSDSEQTVPSHARVKTGVLLSLDAEIAGLLEAAEMPVVHDNHTTKLDAVPPMQGGFGLIDLIGCCVVLQLFSCLANLMYCAAA